MQREGTLKALDPPRRFVSNCLMMVVYSAEQLAVLRVASMAVRSTLSQISFYFDHGIPVQY